MKAFLIIIVLLAGASRAVAQREFVAFENVNAEYKSLVDVHPVVANRGRQTIYLWPQNCREALVSYLGRDGYWYAGDPKPCPRITRPIVLKPGQTYRVLPLVIRFDVVDHFEENRVGVPGKFRIAMFYSFRPVYINGPPHLRETVTREFTIVP